MPNVRIWTGKIPNIILKLASLLNRADIAGLTLGNLIILDDTLPHWDTLQLLGHEITHSVQIASDGYLRFFYRYIYKFLTKGYDNVSYEQEAVKNQQLTLITIDLMAKRAMNTIGYILLGFS